MNKNNRVFLVLASLLGLALTQCKAFDNESYDPTKDLSGYSSVYSEVTEDGVWIEETTIIGSGDVRRQSITIPAKNARGEYITDIGENAFFQHSSMNRVLFAKDSQLKTIRDHGFNNCSALTVIDLPESLETIGVGAFGNCSRLASITIPKNVTSIGSNAFYNCHMLASFEFPEKVTKFEDYLFNKCHMLYTVMMHKDMAEICENAFYGIEECSFYYWGSKEEFKAIKGSKYAPESKMYYFSINKPSEEENDGHYWRYVPDLGPEPWPIEQFTL